VELINTSSFEHNDKIMTLEIEVKPQSFEGKICRLVVVRDVSNALQYKKLEKDYHLI